MSDHVAAAIDAFDRVVTARPGFRPRAGQRKMAEAVADAFASATLVDDSDDEPIRAISVVQAPTGVGKSVAYLVPGISIAKARGVKLLVSVSTVALMEQLATRDLPALQASSSVPFTFAIAKGRQRYLCRLRLMRRLGQDEQDPLDFDEDGEGDAGAATSDSQAVTFYRTLADALDAGWNGDRDELNPPPASRQWASVAAERTTCTVRACPYFNSCAYYAARAQLRGVDVIVSNHSMVLASLGAPVLPDLGNTLLVVDEAHHLPEIAVNQFAARLDLRRVRWLDKLPKVVAAVADRVEHTVRQPVHQAARELKAALADLGRLVLDLLGSYIPEDGVLRFKAGRLPDALEEPLRLIAGQASVLSEAMSEVVTALRAKMQEDPGSNAKWSSLFAALGSHVPALRAVRDAAELLLDVDAAATTAKWISVTKDVGIAVYLNACPIVPGHLLSRELWPKVRGAVLTSATLTSCGEWDFFLREVGLQEDPAVKTMEVESPFDHRRQGEIVVVRTQAPPNRLEAFIGEVSQRLGQDLASVSAGALVLFASRRQLDLTYASLPPALQQKCLVQGHHSRASLLSTHRARVAQGEPSILFGLQSLGEGLDLPGDELSLLVVPKLPFAPPSDPVGEARAEYIESTGGSAFDELVVPAAGVKLLQWTGRLIRTETDRGRIVCYDSRLTQREFGRRMLRGLPPYPVVTADAFPTERVAH